MLVSNVSARTTKDSAATQPLRSLTHRNSEEWWDGKPFDAILLDAPCSATGVIRRHPDIKLLRRASDIDELGALQGDILSALWPLLAPGGRLLYVTCSVLSEENDDVVREFLQASDDAEEDAPCCQITTSAI